MDEDTKKQLYGLVDHLNEKGYSPYAGLVKNLLDDITKLENELQKAKVQGSGLQRIKEVCSKCIVTCRNCPFYLRKEASCILDNTPKDWDIDFILEKLMVKN